MMTSPSTMNKRPRFENARSQDSPPDDDSSVRLCTLAPHEIPLQEEAHICFFDKNGWVLAINSKGTIGAWEIHHTLPGEPPRAPRKVYTFEMPYSDGNFRQEGGGGDRVISLACLMSASNGNNNTGGNSDNERRALIGGSIAGDIYYWSDVKTHLGHSVVAVTHSLFGSNENTEGDYLVSLVPIEGKTDEVVACTQQGRMFRIVCNGR
jgi:hypothetical protein